MQPIPLGLDVFEVWVAESERRGAACPQSPCDAQGSRYIISFNSH